MLGAFCVLRLYLTWSQPLPFVGAEEFLHLRLGRAITGPDQLNPLSAYWNASYAGFGGGAPLVMTLLLTPLAMLPLPGFLSLKLVALAVAVATWALAGVVGRQLLGPQGGKAVLAAGLLLPPGQVAWSCTAFGNYVEGGLLLLVGFALALTCRSGHRGAAFGLGLLVPLEVWFHPILAPVALAHGLLGAMTLGRQARPWRAAAAGGGLGLGLAVLLAPPAGAAVSLPVLQTLEWLAHVGVSRFGVLFGAFTALPVLDGGAWLAPRVPIGGAFIEAALVVALWLSVLLLLPSLWWRGVRGPPLVAGALLAGLALLMPLGFVLAGVGPELPSMGTVHSWEPRRLAVIVPVMQVSLGATLAWLATRSRVAAWGLAIGIGLPAWSLLLVAPDRPEPFRPEALAICSAPGDLPPTICLGKPMRADYEILGARVAGVPIEDRVSKSEALISYQGVQNQDGLCVVTVVPQVPVGNAPKEPYWLKWEFIGRGAVARCGPAADRACDGAPVEARGHCAAGLEDARHLTGQ